MTFTQADSNMQHPEKNVTPSTLTRISSFVDRLFRREEATGIKMPDSEDPKTFSKEYSQSEKVNYTLRGSPTLKAVQAAGHMVKMHPFVAKEGAMTFATAVELDYYDNNSTLWSSNSLYQQKPDPALYLPFKFIIENGTAKANKEDESAMQIRGIKFYVPDFAFFSDNKLMNGLKYEIRVPLYNASFKDTGNFDVTLSWAADNSPTATKTPIATKSVSIGGWSNNDNNNKGTVVFEWTPNLTPNKRYYFHVEIDPNDDLEEVHEVRHLYNSDVIHDYGGNNTGFYPFYVFNFDNQNVTASNVKTFGAADDEISLTPLSFKDGDGKTITDMAAFIQSHSDESFVPITANFNYSGEAVPYAYFVGYVLTPSGKQKIPGAGINTIVDLDSLSYDDVADVFMLQDLALFNGSNQVTLIVSPKELIREAGNIAAKADLITFGIKTITEAEILEAYEEFYEGEYPSFDLEPIPDDIVSESRRETYNLTANENVFWLISSVKFKDTALTSDSGDVEEVEEDDRDYLDITLEAVSRDEYSPENYGKEARITVSSIAGLTPKGGYEIIVQRSTDSGEWENAEVLTFNTSGGEGSGLEWLGSSSSGCNSGLGFAALAFLLGGFMTFRRKS